VSTRPGPRPQQDYGFFGPDSVTWKVFTHPASVTIAFQRTVLTEVLDPLLAASVGDTGSIERRPALRYDRTLQYVATVAFAGSEAVVAAADVLMKVHRRITGVEPISGERYDANDPDAQLWIHLTQWHSVLLSYEIFGPGRLPPAEEGQYWAECRRAAAFQTIDPTAVPADRGEMRAYYERVRPRIAGTERAQTLAAGILDAGGTLVEKGPWYLRVCAPLLRVAMRKGTIATLPRWLRTVAGVRQGRLQDAVVVALLSPGLGVLARRPAALAALLRTTSPLTYPVMAPVLLGVPPVDPVVVTPEEAWARAGLPTPRQQYDALVAARASAPEGETAQEHAPADGTGPLLAFG